MVLHFEVVLHEIPHTCSYLELSPWIYLVLKRIGSVELAFEALKYLNSCMYMFIMFLNVWFEIGFNWTTFGLWFLKLIFGICHIMSFEVFSRKLAQKDRIWYIEAWFWAWGSNLEIPDFGLPLERGKWRSSGKFVYPALLLCLQFARAGGRTLERGLVSHAWACVERPIERDFHTSSTFAVRSGGKSYARADTFVCLSARMG